MRSLILILSLFFAGAAMAQTRPVTDDAGREVTIPEDPKRIVTLHEPLLTLPLLELGMPVVGSYGRGDNGESLLALDFIENVLGADGEALGISGIGAPGNIDLERIRALEPDLIVGTEHDAQKADQLSAIAPVYLQNSRSGVVSGFEAEAALAERFARTDTFDAKKAAYLDRVAEVRDSLPGNPGEETYLAIIIYDQINVISAMSGAIQAIEDLGYSKAEWQGAGKASGYGSGFAVPLSSEAFGRLDPDVLVIMNSYSSDERDEAAIRARLDRIVPGWDRFLKPAREDRIIFLDSGATATPTIASAEHTLDAFEAWARD
ncbi:ABC transporter substrate-binding protein [Amorphus sp. 3PC139-8]|uniref:ABC transporter substrate-binding protein n=1 Tax=Amorphus sp. 3PC139-8 TaxID=2735676 RepID=UPI00345D2606